MTSQTVEFPKDAERISVLNDIRAALARCYFSQGKFVLAEEQARKAHSGRLQLFGQYDLKTLGVEENLCACLVELGMIEEAEKRLQSVLERLTEKVGGSGYLVGRCEGKLANLRARKGTGV
jgi:tetratricopeptide (TPR) repeat protein